ncbi:MAG: DUF4359 domain-containing protein [Cyanobacteriota bacterium]|nr:DUF4359 domain-containing protein [Cyanobacteriota bacterium]
MNNLLKSSFLFLGAIAGILAFSNPPQEVYAENLVWQIKDDCSKQTQLSPITQARCYTITPLPPSAIKPVIVIYTKRKNYFLFSIYTTDMWGMKNQAIGLGGHLFRL